MKLSKQVLFGYIFIYSKSGQFHFKTNEFLHEKKNTASHPADQAMQM